MTSFTQADKKVDIFYGKIHTGRSPWSRGRTFARQPGGPRFKSCKAKSLFDFSTSTVKGLDFEEQLVHVEGKKPALTNRRDQIDIANVDLKWTIVSL